MKFPSYASYDQPAADPMDSLISYVGNRCANEPYELDSKTGLQHKAALLIARGCVELAVESNPHKAKRLLLEARRLLPLEKVKNGSDQLGTAALIQAVCFKNNQAKVKEAREALHVATIYKLRRALARVNSMQQEDITESGGKFGIQKGIINEATTLGLLPRFGPHPWITAWPSLSFHDSGINTAQNVDVIAVESTPDSALATTYPLQVKSGCQGFCGNGSAGRRADRLRYDKDVTLVSGECDLSVTTKNKGSKFPIAELLIAEYEDSLRSADVSRLDETTNNLLLSITTQSNLLSGCKPGPMERA